MKKSADATVATATPKAKAPSLKIKQRAIDSKLCDYAKHLRVQRQLLGPLEKSFPEKITIDQFGLMVAVNNNPGASNKELTTVTSIDRSTLSTLVKKLTERGILVSDRSPGDRRRYSVTLTAKGRKLLEQCVKLEKPFSRKNLSS